MREKLTDEELDLKNNITIEDANSDDYKKEFIKRVVRYETDHYVIENPKTDDPISISDEDIDKHMDKLLELYNDVMSIPYLEMNRLYKGLEHLRKELKFYNLYLYTDKKFNEVDLGMTEGKFESLESMTFDRGDLIALSKTDKDLQESEEQIVLNNASMFLVDYLIKMRYGGSTMSQLDLVIEKLNFDIECLNKGTSINKANDVADIEKSIELISNIGKPSDADGHAPWYTYFMERIVTDKRALNLAKEISRDTDKAAKYVEKIFGPAMIESFAERYRTSANYETAVPTTNQINASVLLMLYTLAKKIHSDMKSKDNRSLIFRGYIIHYMLDTLDERENTDMTNMFKDLFDIYWANPQLLKVLQKI